MFSAKRKYLHRGLAILCFSLLLITIGVARIAESWSTTIDERLGTQSSIIVSQETDSSDPYAAYDFLADYDNTTDLVEANKEMAILLQEEGSVLLKYTQNALPIAAGSKVTLFGMRSYYSVYGGQIGSSAPAALNVNLTTALTEAGLDVNPTVEAAYRHYGEIVTGQTTFFGRTVDVFGYQPGTLKNSFGVGNNTTKLSINELALSDMVSYDTDLADSYNTYDDAAIVVFGRPSSEAADFFPGEAGMENEGARNILGLTTNERTILQEAIDNFSTVIVLINSDSAMEIQELHDNNGVDAILWVGAVGNFGFKGVANILKGDANPSGHLVDIYASDSTSSPAMQNFGIFSFANTDAIEPGGTTNYRGNWYLVEAEGIYTGYRYYESRYADLVTGRGNADSTAGTFDSSGAWKYEEEVTYPFGYGLSYSTFEQELKEVTIANNKKTATVVVSVENTGNVAGKDVVQVYAQAPYIEGGVEKSAIQLMNFAKTNELQPGEKQTLIIDIDMQYLASYDSEGAQTYILDAGDYYFSIGNGSHEALNNILAAQGYTTADGMDANGDAEKVHKWNWSTYDDYTFAISKAGVAVTNQLDDADLNDWLPGTVTYLSRSDWGATWPQSYTNIVASADMITQLRNDTYVIKTGEDTSSIIWGAQSDLKLADMKGADFDDYRWEELLNKITLDEAINLITFGGGSIKGIDSIQSFEVWTKDGPMGFHDTLSTYSRVGSIWYVSPEDENGAYEVRNNPTAVVLGSTFNKELNYELGVLFGNNSIFNGVSMIWAAGLNTHRTPYNARNHEYFSEDPILAGYIGSAQAQGALQKGLIMAVKHFAFNDQESNRAAVAPFMTEQRAREIELRAFQICFEEGAIGTMTAFNRIGATFVNAHEGLMVGILTDEWDFKGYICTDMINGSQYMTLKESIMTNVGVMLTRNNTILEAGGDWDYFNASNISGDYELQMKMKNSLHNVLYAVVNSNAMNGINSTSVEQWQMTSWRAAYISAISVTGLLTAAFTSLFVVSTLKRSKGV